MNNSSKLNHRTRLLSFVTALLLSSAIVPSTIAQQPDGKIAFSNDRDGNGSREIYVTNADGTNQALDQFSRKEFGCERKISAIFVIHMSREI